MVFSISHIWKSEEQTAVVLYFTNGQSKRLDFEDLHEYKGFIAKIRNRM